MPYQRLQGHVSILRDIIAQRVPHDAQELLDRLSQDGPSEVLQAFMAKNQHKPPAGWDGVMVLDAK